LRNLFSGLLLGLLLLVLFTGPVLAIGNPDYVSIGDTYVFRNVSEAGDQLFFCRYDVSYNSVPDEDPDDTWQMALYNSTGSLIATRSLNYYQHNIISIYLDADDALVWEGAHQIKIMGMPSVFGNLTEGINMRTNTLGPDDYYEKDYLAGIMITQAGILEADWEITLLTASDKLNSTGKTFFLLAVPGLGDMVPEIFEIVTHQQDVDYVSYNDTYAAGLSSHAGDKLTGAVTDIGGIMGVSFGWTSFWFAMLALLLMGGIVFAGHGNPVWAMLGGLGMVAVFAFLFGGGIFTLLIVVAFALALGFGISYILGKFV